MRILIYGFGPYRQFRSNITGKVLRRLPRRHDLTKIIFPVRFDRRQFTDAIKHHRPDFVIGLGQCSRGSKLRIETRALNQRRNRKADAARKIAPANVTELKTNFPIACGTAARRSRFAGDYVCNYSMYVMLDFLRRTHSGARYGFIHIPHDYDVRKAVRFVGDLIGKVAKGDRVPV